MTTGLLADVCPNESGKYCSANIDSPMGQGTGTYPSVDAWGGNFRDRYRSALSGQRIAGDYVAVLEGVQGDQDFIRILFNPSRYFTKQFCCYYCRARSWLYSDENPLLSDYLYTNFGVQAPHRRTLVTLQEWCDVHPQTPLTTICGWSPWRILPDMMHIVHLALLPDAIVSTLLDWSDDRRLWDGSSRDARLSMMWSSYKEWAGNQGDGFQDCASRKLFTTRVLQPETTSYTEISQKILSATAARYMVHWLCSLAVHFCQCTGDESDMYRAGVASGIAEMELVALRANRVLTMFEWSRFEQGYLLYRSACLKLCHMALEKGQARWRQRPKGHSLEHLCYDFHFLNPRYTSNFLDEDFIRRSKRLALKAHPRFVSKHVIFRYAIAATLRWTQMQPV